MTTQAIRERLHHFIDEADEKQLKNIFALIEDHAVVANWWEDDAFVAELDERVRRYEQGIDRAYTWEETEALIAERKNKRSAK